VVGRRSLADEVDVEELYELSKEGKGTWSAKRKREVKGGGKKAKDGLVH
jgi:hypothetical protein